MILQFKGRSLSQIVAKIILDRCDLSVENPEYSGLFMEPMLRKHK
jgi:hypothetical protein